MKKQASKAQKVCTASGVPNFASFKVVARVSLIKSSTVTTEDVQLAEKSYSPDLGSA